MYPYPASHTRLASTFIPKEYVNGQLTEYLADPQLRQQFKERGLKRWDPELAWVQLTVCTAYPAYTGLRINEAAKLHGKDSWETLFDIMEKQPGCTACYFTICEEDIETVMSWNRAMICTDSGVAGEKSVYHPRLRGSFPRVLGRYVRERQVVSLPEMIRKMTSLPAQVYHLTTKGKIAPGYDADICIFDPETIIDRATFTEVYHRAEGLNYVIVSGEVAAENAVFNGTTAGRVLLRKEAIQ